MKLFSFRIRAISVFIFDSGMSTRRCFDPQALRIRVSMSAIGSVMLMSDSFLLSYPWTWSNECENGGGMEWGVRGDGVRRHSPPPTPHRSALPARLAHAR